MTNIFCVKTVKYLTVQWNADIRRSEIQTMPKSELCHVRLYMFRFRTFGLVQMTNSFGFRHSYYKCPKSERSNMHGQSTERLKSERNRLDFSIIVVQTKIATKL